MVYVQPRVAFSSIVIDGGTYEAFNDEHAAVKVDIEFIIREADTHFGVSDAIVCAFKDELGVKHLDVNYRNPFVIEIRDEDVDKVANFNLEIEADEVLDEDTCRTFLIDYYNHMPGIVKLSGSIRIEGFEVVN